MPDAPASPHPPPARPGVFHGVCEVAAFFGAAGWAVAELALGRWPSPKRPPKSSRRTDPLGPFPIND